MDMEQEETNSEPASLSVQVELLAKQQKTFADDLDFVIECLELLKAKTSQIEQNTGKHTHTIDQVTDLQAILNNKSGLGHNHSHYDIVKLSDLLTKIEKRLDALESAIASCEGN